MDFYDSNRNRNIPTKIYYPANESGEDVAIASGNFPVLLFGHGFLMSWDAYENFWAELVPKAYIICFPTTEMSISPDHDSFGLDLKFIANEMQNLNEESSSLFFNSILPKTALMGHSMGGGASFLAAEDNSSISTLINFAAAETTPSAISATTNINTPTLIFSGDDDCVAPATEHQNPMYEGLNSDCKTLISIKNGGHCYFANDNFTCNLGESFCNPELDINREEQQNVTFNFLNLWLKYTLHENENAFVLFQDSLQTSTRINFSQSCTSVAIQEFQNHHEIKTFPNPVVDQLNLIIPEENSKGLITIYNIFGQRVHQSIINKSKVQINVSKLPKGMYTIKYFKYSFQYSGKFIKTGNE